LQELFLVVASPLSLLARKHFGAFVVAFEISRSASLVASMGLQHHRALLRPHLHDALRKLGHLLVHPLLLKLGALVSALRVLALSMAFLDDEEILASFHKYGEGLWALLVALGIFAARCMAHHRLLHRILHFLPMLVMIPLVVAIVSMVLVVVIIACVVIAMVVAMLVVLIVVVVAVVVPAPMVVVLVVALVVAFHVFRAACLVAGMGLQHHWALLLSHLGCFLRVLSKLLVHPLHLELGALVARLVFAR